MPYDIGVKTTQRFEEQPAVQSVNVALVCALIAPLYDVHEQVSDDDEFSPLSGAAQSFDWPGKRTGTIVDFTGVKRGVVDPQFYDYIPFPPRVFLVDGETYTELDTTDFYDLTQSNFKIKATAAAALARTTLGLFAVKLADEVFLFNASGGLGSVLVGDQLTFGANSYTISSKTSKRLYVTPQTGSSALVGGSFDDYLDDGASTYVDIAVASAPGRVTITLGGAPPSNTPAVGDPIICGRPVVGHTAISGATIEVAASDDTIDGITFPSSVEDDAFTGWPILITYDLGGGGEASALYTVVSVDSDAGEIVVDDTIGGGVEDTPLRYTLYEPQLGHIESYNSSSQVFTVVLQTPFTLADCWFYHYHTDASTAIYPTLTVAASYRALRRDKVGQVDTVGESELLATIGASSAEYASELGYMAQHYFNCSPGSERVMLVYVDPEPSGTTGLPENHDKITGYTSALTLLQAQECYVPILGETSAAFGALLESHCTAMYAPDKKRERVAYRVYDLDLGEVNSTTGVVRPGHVAGGTVDSARNTTEGNGLFYDDEVAFVSEAGLSTGDTLVITEPPELAGTYTVGANTTDDVLEIDDLVWPIVHTLTLGPTSPAKVAQADTIGGSQHTISSPTTSGLFKTVDPGDYVEIKVSSTRYRARVLTVASTGASITIETETASAPSFSAADVTELSVIRSWGGELPKIKWYALPRTSQEIVDATIADKASSNRLVSWFPNNQVTLQLGVDAQGDAITKVAPALYSLISGAAWRCGQEAYEEVTGQYLGGTVLDIERGFGFFDEAQLNELGGSGLMWISKVTPSAAPYFRDYITAAWSTSTIAQGEEVVRANADWQAKAVRAAFGPKPGVSPPRNNTILLSLRRANMQSLLEGWKQKERRIEGYRNLQVSRVSGNPRSLLITYDVIQVVYNKDVEIIFTNTITV